MDKGKREKGKPRKKLAKDLHSVSKSSPSSSGSHSKPEYDKDIFFIIPRVVYVVYGPYMYEGIMDFRTERLQGLKTLLEKIGVTVVLKPCLDHVNLVRVWFLEEAIFSCQITDLMCGGDGELDSLCRKAAEALESFIKKVLRGLRQTKTVTPKELKRPFCPCFHRESDLALAQSQSHHDESVQSDHEDEDEGEDEDPLNAPSNNIMPEKITCNRDYYKHKRRQRQNLELRK